MSATCLVAHRPGNGLADGVGTGGVPAVPLHLPVELVLHPVGVADVLEERVALLPRGLHLEVAGADDPLPDALVEVDVADPIERDLDAVAGENAGPVQDPLVRHHEVGAEPLEVLEAQPGAPDEHQDHDRPLHDVGT